MLTSPSSALLDEVRGFLSELRRDCSELFAPARRPAPALPAVPPPSAGLEALFHGRAAFWAPRLGVGFGRVRVKDTRSRWGSCSPAGDLNFNWRLTLAPPEVLDYVVIHELAHRLEMNHGRRFWAHVNRHCPEHRAHRRWLRANGEALYRAERSSSGPS